MSETLLSLGSNPYVLAIVLLLAVVLFYGLIKRLFKLALAALLILAGVIIWFRVTGTEMPEPLEELSRHGEKVIETVKDEGGKLLEKGGEAVKEKLEEHKKD